MLQIYILKFDRGAATVWAFLSSC